MRPQSERECGIAPHVPVWSFDEQLPLLLADPPPIDFFACVRACLNSPSRPIHNGEGAGSVNDPAQGRTRRDAHGSHAYSHTQSRRGWRPLSCRRDGLVDVKLPG